MAGPLTGIGAGQQIPVSNNVVSPQSTNQNQQVRPQQEDEQRSGTNEVQAQTSQTPDTLSSETDNQDVLTAQQSVEIDATGSSESAERGSLIDITV